jgi:hypothetical protein
MNLDEYNKLFHKEQLNLVAFKRLMDCDEEVLRLVNAAIAAEREAIAQMIEDAPPLVEFAQNSKGGCMVCGFTPKLAAEVIRARGNT